MTQQGQCLRGIAAEPAGSVPGERQRDGTRPGGRGRCGGRAGAEQRSSRAQQSGRNAIIASDRRPLPGCWWCCRWPWVSRESPSLSPSFEHYLPLLSCRSSALGRRKVTSEQQPKYQTWTNALKKFCLTLFSFTRNTLTSVSISPKHWRLHSGKYINKEQLGNAFSP